MTPRSATWDGGWSKAWFVKRGPLGRGSLGKQTVSQVEVQVSGKYSQGDVKKRRLGWRQRLLDHQYVDEK